MHASGDSPCHASAKHPLLAACLLLRVSFRVMLLTLAEWSAKLRHQGSWGTCIPQGVITFFHTAFTAHSDAGAEAIGRRLQAIVRGLGGCAASHVEGTGAAPGALCYPALDTVGRRDRPRIGAVCPFVRLVSGVSDHIIGDRPRPDPVWETARLSVPPASHGSPASVACDWRLP